MQGGMRHQGRNVHTQWPQHRASRGLPDIYAVHLHQPPGKTATPTAQYVLESAITPGLGKSQVKTYINLHTVLIKK